ncbi:hypothetical protein BN7_6720 [Wickerhamomyces ciferrii]|uniref:Uncharacterized protein n=1 Tax=Wickerhamomyces ciferrii (strain ATCC 14091 / BCRC 22168 / CBS 111 / JCM 3599 / NBRC 0793 / NRRL Y-1031 F-60-10) TaxID=1206466 RepID=K0L0L4_WICCF|nr:uncharacterized protein BN7_6720 [Wickerhamomyces ciferrii]CCH47109.1 hypothetical protein BN7_6720 [Wickerhamomyces ciferrii]
MYVVVIQSTALNADYRLKFDTKNIQSNIPILKKRYTSLASSFVCDNLKNLKVLDAMDLKTLSPPFQKDMKDKI